jgi:uncharacterized membrane protein YfcA
MNAAASFAASFFGAALSAMGLGGGGIFLSYLTAFLGQEQLKAQGINLVFFIPVAAVALFIHIRNGLVRWRAVWPCVLAGLPGVWLGSWLAAWFDSALLSKMLALLLAIIGIRELISPNFQKNQNN